MNTLDINTIAFQYLLRTNSQKTNKSEELTSEPIKYDPEQYIRAQKSLLFQMYDVEEEDLYI